jgi:hypothetical protein
VLPPLIAINCLKKGAVLTISNTPLSLPVMRCRRKLGKNMAMPLFPGGIVQPKRGNISMIPAIGIMPQLKAIADCSRLLKTSRKKANTLIG